MAFLSSLDIAGSGMTAQKKRLDVITENITNRETTRTEDGGPYRRKLSVFTEIEKGGSFSGIFKNARLNQARQSGTLGGVMVSEVIEDESDFIPVYDPNHPDAGEDGYVMMPNVNNTVEMIDAMSATRSYSANIAAFEAIKAMAAKALEIGR
ncbi:MAG: flagellar basal body rod protein FlgC [Oscillospiraceae bacterium]|jgi:flagellar basal-body rod protein FlgC|nr:flagellar basal body rod protein FlgC [Oscillospiraceae bacterium]